MKIDSLTIKLFVIGFIAVVCSVASLLVFALVEERESRFMEAKMEVARGWGERQTIMGPVLVFGDVSATSAIRPVSGSYVLPTTLSYEVTLEPEVRSRGIFKTTVYTATIQATGLFARSNIDAVARGEGSALLSLGLTDTRGIEEAIGLSWAGSNVEFSPGSAIVGDSPLELHGLHAQVLVPAGSGEYPFSFELHLRGSGGILFAPVGEETNVRISSPWPSPKFTGEYLPDERSVTDSGFEATWRVSSFGRTYPQTGDTLNITRFSLERLGVDLFEGVELYTQVTRSIKYAVLFIIVTFMTFFLFEILRGARVHPVQYLLVGSALALFYLLLLSFAEYIGFAPSYIIAACMTIGLITLYSASALGGRRRAVPVCAALLVLYAYLYFVLSLEDYALIAGALLVFGLLAAVMYLTRGVEWEKVSSKTETEKTS